MKLDREAALSEVLLDLRISRVRRQSARPGISGQPRGAGGKFQRGGGIAVEFVVDEDFRAVWSEEMRNGSEGFSAANKEAFEFAGESRLSVGVRATRRS